MKFRCERDKLDEAVSAVSVRARRGQTIPILSHVLVRATSNGVDLTGHDLGGCIRVSIPAEVETQGEITLSCDAFARLVHGLAAGCQVKFSVAGGVALVAAGRSTYKFATLPAEDFPEFLTAPDGVEFTLSGTALARLLKAPLPAVGVEETRKYLCGIFLHHQDGKIIGVATDGVMLVRTEVAQHAPAFDGIIIPSDACTEITKLVGEADAKITISLIAIAVTSGAKQFASRLIDGAYPDYGRVIPQATAPAMTVDTSVFLAALSRLVAARDTDKKATAPGVRLSWDANPQTVKASVRTQSGEGAEEIEIECASRKAGEVGFQIAKLERIIEAIDADVTRIFINGPGDSVRIESANATDIVGVVMPFRV